MASGLVYGTNFPVSAIICAVKPCDNRIPSFCAAKLPKTNLVTGAFGIGAGTAMGRDIGVTLGDETGALGIGTGTAMGCDIGGALGDETGASVDGAIVGALPGGGANRLVIRFKRKRIHSRNDILNIDSPSSTCPNTVGIYY